MSIENQNPNYGYTRRQELSCTLDELANYSNVVLLDREVLYVKQADGTYDIKIGDNKTTVGELPYVIRHSELKSFKEAAEAARAAAETARSGAQTAEQNAKNALTDVNNSISRLEASKATVESVAAVAKQVDNLNQQTSEALASVRKRVANLEGAALDFVADSTDAVTKIVPTDALPYAEVTKIGGMTRKCTNFLDAKEFANNSVTAVENADGTVTITNTSVGKAGAWILATGKLPAGTYTVKNDTARAMYVMLASDDYEHTTNNTKSVTFDYDGVSYLRFAFVDIPGGEVFTTSIMLNKGTTVLPYEPYFEGLRSATVSEITSEGLQLIPFPYFECGAGASVEKQGITYTVNAYGLITANGTSTGYSTFVLSTDMPFKAGETYTRTLSEGGVSFVISYTEAGTTQYISAPSFTWGVGWTFKSAYLQINPGVTVNNITISPMLNKGSTVLPWRPYFKHTLPILADIRPAHGISKDACDYIEWKADGTRKKYECIGYATPPTIAKVHTRSNGIPYITFNVSGVKANTKILPSFKEYSAEIYTDNDMSVYYSGGGFVVNDSRFTSVDEANRILNGFVVYYELATPIVTDISNILTPDNYIEVEGGGTITAVTELNVGAPTTIYYATEKTGG